MEIVTGIVIGLHVAVSLVLVLLVLLHSGRGSGMSEMFGGGMGPAHSSSTVVERNLDRLTVVSAILFAITTMVLSWLMR